MTDTINLFKVGKVAALLAKNLEPEMFSFWNYGFAAEVLGVYFKTEKALTIELKYLNTNIGENYKIKKRKAVLTGPLRIRYK